METNNENYMQVIGNYGWICPICKRALSPTVIECPHHNKVNDYDKLDWTLTSTIMANEQNKTITLNQKENNDE